MIPEWSGNRVPELIAQNQRAEWEELLSSIDKLYQEYLPSSGDTNVKEVFSVECEVCKEKEATVYCNQDKAHLCEACDEIHHSGSKLLMKHSRLPVFHSPFQFGFCQVHRSDRYECVCLECGVMLCQLCLLVGSHADQSDHPVVSTMEAFRLSLTPPGGDFEGILSKVNGKAFFAVPEKKQSLVNELQEKHQLVVQAEGSHWQLQQVLDKELRNCLDSIERIRKKRIDFLNSLRREDLLLLTLLEWYQAFQVHARLSLSPSLWLGFFKACSREDLLIPSLLGATRSVPVTSVSDFIASLPSWVTSQVEMEGQFSVHTDTSIQTERFDSAYRSNALTSSQFEWVPSSTDQLQLLPEAKDLSPETLRRNRLAARMEELVGQPQKEADVRKLTIPFPANLGQENPIPVENVKEFVMQTLAVLAESEARIPNLDFFMETSETAVSERQEQKPASVGLGLPPPIVQVVEDREEALAGQLKQLLSSGGRGPFSNAVALLSSAPTTERQDLFLAFVYLFRSDPLNVEDLVNAICKDTVEKVEASSFLVSGISMLVPLTAAFQLALYPKDSVFLDLYVQNLVLPTSLAPELAVNQFIAKISMPSSNIAFPQSLVFLLQAVHTACLARFSAQVSIGVVSGLFLARVVSPRLVFAAPKTDTQPPIHITLMTRYIHRIAGAAAEGQSALARSDDPLTSGILTAISQLNGLIMRNVLQSSMEDKQVKQLPSISGGLTPRSAGRKVDRKLQEYGSSLPF